MTPRLLTHMDGWGGNSERQETTEDDELCGTLIWTFSLGNRVSWPLPQGLRGDSQEIPPSLLYGISLSPQSIFTVAYHFLIIDDYD